MSSKQKCNDTFRLSLSILDFSLLAIISVRLLEACCFLLLVYLKSQCTWAAQHFPCNCAWNVAQVSACKSRCILSSAKHMCCAPGYLHEAFEVFAKGICVFFSSFQENLSLTRFSLILSVNFVYFKFNYLYYLRYLLIIVFCLFVPSQTIPTCMTMLYVGHITQSAAYIIRVTGMMSRHMRVIQMTSWCPVSIVDPPLQYR